MRTEENATRVEAACTSEGESLLSTEYAESLPLTDEDDYTLRILAHQFHITLFRNKRCAYSYQKHDLASRKSIRMSRSSKM